MGENRRAWSVRHQTTYGRRQNDEIYRSFNMPCKRSDKTPRAIHAPKLSATKGLILRLILAPLK